jgi:TetR/AcrR family transcriptional regulator
LSDLIALFLRIYSPVKFFYVVKTRVGEPYPIRDNRNMSTAAKRRAAPSSPGRPGTAPQSAAMRGPRAARVRKQEQILREAERQFARFGFEGVSLDSIAAELGISRQNMLYYFASKDDLYRAVLDGVLASWLQGMEALAKGDDPRAAISGYIRAKLRFSRERPSGSAVFTREVMAGAPRYAERLAHSVIPRLRADIRTFEKWARQGLIERVDFTHLMFVIWSATQAYADLAPQFALFIGKPQLDDADFDAAHALLTEIVTRTLSRASS